MSRNREFFHGSSQHFKVGDLIDPSYDTYGEGEVHATNDKKWASTFGDSLYSVKPVGDIRKVNEDGKTEHWVSRSGLRVTKVHY